MHGEEQRDFCALKCFREHSKQLRCQKEGVKNCSVESASGHVAGGTFSEKCRSNCTVYCDRSLRIKFVMNLMFV